MKDCPRGIIVEKSRPSLSHKHSATSMWNHHVSFWASILQCEFYQLKETRTIHICPRHNFRKFVLHSILKKSYQYFCACLLAVANSSRQQSKLLFKSSPSERKTRFPSQSANSYFSICRKRCSRTSWVWPFPSSEFQWCNNWIQERSLGIFLS